MSLKNDHYTYRVTWSEEDNEYVGLCTEFPSLSWLSSSPEKSLKGVRQIVSKTVADMLSNSEPVPQPLSSKHYSGKFMVRIPPTEHRVLALKAAEAGVSLNRLISSLLSNPVSLA